MLRPTRTLANALMVVAALALCAPAASARSSAIPVAKYTKRSHRAFFHLPKRVFNSGRVNKLLLGRRVGSWAQLRFTGQAQTVRLVGDIKVVDNKTQATVAKLRPKRASQREVLQRHIVHAPKMHISEALLYVNNFRTVAPRAGRPPKGGWTIPTHGDFTAVFEVDATFKGGSARRHQVALPIQLGVQAKSRLDRFWD